MKKSNKKGFTLVELVVVIAIIGVLAAILVPSMMGYVKKSRLKTANSNAKSAYNAIATYVADQETKGEPVDWTAGGVAGDYDCKSNTAPTGGSADVAKICYDTLGENGKEAGIAHVGPATINGKATFFVQWRKTASDDMIGQYPDAIADVEAAQTATWGNYVS